MASLRDLKSRITSVKNTRKITRAMKMVAASKMNRAVEAAKAARPYQETIMNALNRVIAAEDSIEHPLLSIPDNNADVLLIVLTSDRGLCGGFNSHIIKHTKKTIAFSPSNLQMRKCHIYIIIQNASLPIYVLPCNDECLNAHRKLIEERGDVPGGNPGI